jgi:hypothetical protein
MTLHCLICSDLTSDYDNELCDDCIEEIEEDYAAETEDLGD